MLTNIINPSRLLHLHLQLLQLACLFATLASAQFSINLPKPGSVIQPGQDLTVQLFVPLDTSPAAGLAEISLAIGIVNCPNSTACPDPSVDLGTLVFVGTYDSQGQAPTNGFDSFANISVRVPNTVDGAGGIGSGSGSGGSGRAAIQVLRVAALTPPGHSLVSVDYLSTQITTISQGGGGSTGSSLNIHPNGDNSKCVGVLGGVYADGTPVDIFDCNQSATQKWQFNGPALQSTNPTDGSTWCLDSGVQSTWTNGLKMKIWQCLPNLPQQTWAPVTTGNSGSIKLTAANFCLDLTDGVKSNQNVLQIWTCGAGNVNQIWSVTSV